MNAPRETVLRQHERGRAAIPFRGDGAHRQDDRGERPELGEVLPGLVDGVGGDRGRDGDRRQLIAGRRLDDLGQELGEQRRGQPDEQEEAGDDRQAHGPPRLEQLLAQQDRAAGHAAARPFGAASGSRPTRRRKTSSSDGRARSKAASRSPAATTSGSSPADAAASSVTDTVSRPSPLGDPVDPGRATQRRRERRDRRVLPGLRVDPVERLGEPCQERLERALGHQPTVVEDRRPGRRSARRRRGRGSRR